MTRLRSIHFFNKISSRPRTIDANIDKTLRRFFTRKRVFFTRKNVFKVKKTLKTFIFVAVRKTVSGVTHSYFRAKPNIRSRPRLSIRGGHFNEFIMWCQRMYRESTTPILNLPCHVLGGSRLSGSSFTKSSGQGWPNLNILGNPTVK